MRRISQNELEDMLIKRVKVQMAGFYYRNTFLADKRRSVSILEKC